MVTTLLHHGVIIKVLNYLTESMYARDVTIAYFAGPPALLGILFWTVGYKTF